MLTLLGTSYSGATTDCRNLMTFEKLDDKTNLGGDLELGLSFRWAVATLFCRGGSTDTVHVLGLSQTLED
jgi:hypothetical protein